jgi:hypothetical protein
MRVRRRRPLGDLRERSHKSAFEFAFHFLKDFERRRWWINVESAVVLSDARKKSNDLTTATVPAGTTFPAVSRESCDLLMGATRQPSSLTS